MDVKAWMGVLSLVIAGVQYAPYCWSTYKGKIRPHVFSYYIWGVSSGIVALAQYVDNGGAGAWAMGFSAVACFAVGVLSARGGVGYITRSDWIFLAVALASIPLWIITKNPLSAVLLLTVIDGSAYLPSFRKAHVHPYEDMPSTYIIGGAKHMASLLAMENYTFTTTLTPAFIVVANAALIILLFWRRAALRRIKDI